MRLSVYQIRQLANFLLQDKGYYKDYSGAETVVKEVVAHLNRCKKTKEEGDLVYLEVEDLDSAWPGIVDALKHFSICKSYSDDGTLIALPSTYFPKCVSIAALQRAAEEKQAKRDH